MNLGHLEYSQLTGQNGQILLRSSKTVLCESGILKFEYKELISLKKNFVINVLHGLMWLLTSYSENQEIPCGTSE